MDRNQWILSGLVFFMTVLILGVSLLDSSEFDKEPIVYNHPIQQQNHQEEDSISPEIQEWMTCVDVQIQELQRTQALWHQRVWLNSLVINENANISRSLLNSQNYIIIDGNWKLNRTPTTMNLTPEQIAELQRHVR